MLVITLIGGLTAFYAATCALAQNEIKRVLAYSTMSQIGYMFMAVGAGTVSGAMFHLYTHAFFKALLFMGAGCVIHLCAEENDIHKMGGVAGKSPFVFVMFLAGALCLAGLPLSGGFFSKDGILLAIFAHSGGWYRLAWLLGLLTALLTSFYTFRLLFLVFAGSPRVEQHLHKLPSLMRWTLPPLALFGLAGGLLNLPAAYGGEEALQHLLGPLAGFMNPVAHQTESVLAVIATGLFLLGALAAFGRYRSYPGRQEDRYRDFLRQGWQADSLVARAILRPFEQLADFHWKGLDLSLIEGLLQITAEGCLKHGARVARMTTGRVSTYLAGFGWGLLLLLGWFLLSLAGH
jgi:NADH-quinone oxidoreductase subunit L